MRRQAKEEEKSGHSTSSRERIIHHSDYNRIVNNKISKRNRYHQKQKAKELKEDKHEGRKLRKEERARKRGENNNR